MVDKLISAQEEVAAHISRALSNYKKSKSRISKSFVDSRLELLESDFTVFKTNHLEVFMKATPEDRETFKYFKENRYYVCEDEYLELKALMKEFLYEHAQKSAPTQVITSGQVSANVNIPLRTKLPAIEIPPFSGNYNDWTSFYDLFKSLIHCNESLSKIQKYHYLKSNLRGEAEILLRQFPLTEANYERALELLESRYENKRLITHSHITRLLNQKKLSVESAKGLRDLLDTTNECLSALNNIGVSTTNWDPIVTHVIVAKFDNESLRLWEQKLGGSRDIPTIKELIDFLDVRFRSLESMNMSTQKDSIPKSRQPIKTFKVTSEPLCVFCSQDHYVYNCKEFGNLTPKERREFAVERKLCFNCLIPHHSFKICRQTKSCRICNHRHHSLLHTPDPTSEAQTAHNAQIEEDEETQVAVYKAESYCMNQVLLVTALVKVRDKVGKMHTLRALVDQGSQASFITASAAQRLGLKRLKVYSTITGVNPDVSMTSKEMIEIQLFSSQSERVVTQVKAHILKSLSSILPRREVCLEVGSEINTLKLADPTFTTPGGIDLLLGAEVYAQILLDGIQRFGTLIAQNSVLGWLVSGMIVSSQDEHANVLSMHSQLEMDDLIQRFWQSEELLTETRIHTASEIQCEKIFEETHTRTISGRYTLALPFSQENSTPLGGSRYLAVKRLLQMERRFHHNKEFGELYKNFMKEYEMLQHMEKVPQEELHKTDVCYLPHHGVLREESVSTKLRVVYDGSAKTSTGTALNEQLLTGPSLQHDIRDLFLRWRSHKICLVADIKQMYRQILVRKEDQDYQRIVWRETPRDQITDYRLCTVTYGTSCAPYLAIKTLRQLACDERDKFPEAASVLERDFYTDDLLSGCDTEDEAIRLCHDLINLLDRGGFVLHKWGSNSREVLDNLPTQSNQTQGSRDILMEKSVKALGIRWNPKNDCFELGISLPDSKTKLTKRNVLSDIAKIYDPLGWLSPVVVVAKIFLQRLWLLGIGWDDELPVKYQEEWFEFRDNCNSMPVVNLPRWITISKANNRIEIHGFSDASNSAYASVVYVRVFNESNIEVKMVAAKTKVAPIKQITIPRLELCGAVLTAKLCHRVKICLQVPDDCVYVWTDSTIVLAWLQKHPNSWKPFVGNRVAEILNLTRSNQWRHVGTKENPADYASRGILASQLPTQELWWNGPDWLKSNLSFAVDNELHVTDLEQRVSSLNVNVINSNEWILHRYSNLSRLQRVIAYCFRFYNACKNRVTRKKSNDLTNVNEFPNYLTMNELRNAMNCCIKISQDAYFNRESTSLAQGNNVSRKSPLYFLRPFLDEQLFIRVGGRLKNAPIPHDIKHPIVLSGKSYLSKLIVTQTHVRTLHGGPLLMLNVIRANYWITNVKSLVKSHVRNCVKCVRHAPKFVSQLMGNLPSARVTVSKPFSNSGVDFAGPCYLKTSTLRKAPITKAYIAIFICTATKAIHLELVSELSTSAFIAGFKRFTSRRGHCAHLYSDCGSNFIGANYELARMLTRAKAELPIELSELLASDGTEWHFIPPGSPHFGGLWEAGVRSVKHHINRVLGDTKLTFEEYSTLLAQIECCLNSRPISAMSNSADDFTALTPGHFLVFGPPTIVPHENVIDVPINRLNRWQHIEHILQSFWQRWKQEYLTTLQHRYKWTEHNNPIKINDLVIIKNEVLPPSKWPLGRVVNTHPGNDGLVRVVTVKCQTSEFKRPITKLCLLPVDASV